MKELARLYLERDRGRKGNGEFGKLLLQLKIFKKDSLIYIESKWIVMKIFKFEKHALPDSEV